MNKKPKNMGFFYCQKKFWKIIEKLLTNTKQKLIIRAYQIKKEWNWYGKTIKNFRGNAHQL